MLDIILIFFIMIGVSVVHAESPSTIETVADVIDFNIDLNSKIDLYDNNENIIAHFYQSQSMGYLIVDAITNRPIEYSNETNRDFFSNQEQKFYYGGPFMYFVEENETQLRGVMNEIIDKAELDFSVDSTEFNPNNMRKVETRALTRTTYTPRNYSYNPNYICASTASAILLMYYNVYVNQAYVPTSYESTGTGEKTVKYLVPYINPNNRGATISEIRTGLNKYLKDRGLTQSATTLAKSEVQLPIASNRPGIMLISNHPKYGNHAVVAYGYNRYVEGTDTIYMIMVVDGWGSTGVYVDRNYSTGGVRI